MTCQLKRLNEAAIKLPHAERLRKQVKKKILFTIRHTKALVSSIIKKLFLSKPKKYSKTPEQDFDGQGFPPLNLKEGEKARVKSLEEIKKTLDQNNKYQGLEYTLAMDKYCGGTYTVFKRIERAFDERKWKLSKIKNVVILEGVFCDGGGGIESDWDKCDRCCFLWWKEVWLERVSE